MAKATRVTASNSRNGFARGAVGSLGMLLMLLVCGIPLVPAADELPTIAAVNPVPAIEIRELPHFDVLGRIDEIHTDYMIVEDTLIRNDEEFPPEYIRESDRRQLTRSSFRAGDFVGVQQSGIGSLERLWKFDRPLE